MGAHENWGSCDPCAVGMVESWTGMSHADFATLTTAREVQALALKGAA